ncbi:hypothetical protein ACIBQ1_31880 [Nonomuraea sp. NPDC050153]
MVESSSYLTATADAYDAVAELYADLARDSLETRSTACRWIAR